MMNNISPFNMLIGLAAMASVLGPMLCSAILLKTPGPAKPKLLMMLSIFLTAQGGLALICFLAAWLGDGLDIAETLRPYIGALLSLAVTAIPLGFWLFSKTYSNAHAGEYDGLPNWPR